MLTATPLWSERTEPRLGVPEPDLCYLCMNSDLFLQDMTCIWLVCLPHPSGILNTLFSTACVHQQVLSITCTECLLRYVGIKARHGHLSGARLIRMSDLALLMRLGGDPRKVALVFSV